MKDLSSPTRERTRAHFVGSEESQPLDHHGSLSRILFITAALLDVLFIAFL